MSLIPLNIITAQIKQRANGQPFDTWNMSDLEPTRDAFLNWVYALKTSGTTEKQKEFGEKFQRNPTTKFTIEELCLIWILVNDPGYIGLTEPWADDFYLKIYQRVIFSVGVTERKTTLTNEIASYKISAQQNPDGIANNLPENAPTNEINSTTVTNTFSLSESIKAAFNSPLVWVLIVFALYQIIKKRKNKNEQ